MGTNAVIIWKQLNRFLARIVLVAGKFARNTNDKNDAMETRLNNKQLKYYMLTVCILQVQQNGFENKLREGNLFVHVKMFSL